MTDADDALRWFAGRLDRCGLAVTGPPGGRVMGGDGAALVAALEAVCARAAAEGSTTAAAALAALRARALALSGGIGAAGARMALEDACAALVAAAGPAWGDAECEAAGRAAAAVRERWG